MKWENSKMLTEYFMKDVVQWETVQEQCPNDDLAIAFMSEWTF